jgi:hypothetical protein
VLSRGECTQRFGAQTCTALFDYLGGCHADLASKPAELAACIDDAVEFYLVEDDEDVEP